MNPKNKGVCLTCEWRRERAEPTTVTGRSGRTYSLVVRYCGQDGIPITDHVNDGVCPLDLFMPDEPTPEPPVGVETPTPIVEPPAPFPISPTPDEVAAVVESAGTVSALRSSGTRSSSGCGGCSRAALKAKREAEAKKNSGDNSEST